ncbi:hypothetical protein FJT64_000266 [Amphibalanus amphitrite]|uniref:Protein ANTAGONIST OF LIKE HETEROCHROMATIN PROTEIN 1 n=1 Tax=Amphibalanus amphitrite TaxID=1232801 RepID=A0A6A4WII0_AMPAM|nr:hypothetical protein FJT64_000266 [Amphibalanus amphitrite]
MDRQTLLRVLFLRRERERQRRSLWVRPVLLRREECGEFHTLVQELRQNDPEGHRRYFRMSVNEFDEVLGKIEPVITKEITHLRKPISAAERLAATLRHFNFILGIFKIQDVRVSVGLSPRITSRIISASM